VCSSDLSRLILDHANTDFVLKEINVH